MNILPNPLQDAKGYRSPFINNLNANVTANRIIGGDVIPSTESHGTTLHLKNGEGKKSRWQMFLGMSPLKRSVVAIADGSIYIDNQLIKLKNGINGKYVKQGLLPRGSGWFYDATPSSWGEVSAIIYRYKSQSSESELYYLLFSFDGTVPTNEIETFVEGDEIAEVVKIATYTKATNKIEQFITSDIYISSGTSEETTLLPWEIVQYNGSLYVANPLWELNAPYSNYPIGATPPSPEYAQGFDNMVNPDFAVEINGVKCYLVGDSVYVTDGTQNISLTYTHLYACMSSDGVLWGLGLATSDTYFTESPCCLLIAKVNRDSNGNVTSIEQVRKGKIKSVWLETDKFYVEATSSGIVRHAEAPTGLAEGTEMQLQTFWKMRTSMNDVVLREEEDLNYSNASSFAYPQPALSYGGYIWRFNLHYNASAQALIIDNVTTPVLNVETSNFAKVVASPFVERIQVTYPDSPLSQGHVSSVGGTINVLAVEVPSTSETELFKTESIDATEENSLIEVD